MASSSGAHPFTILADAKPRWGCFGTSLGLETAVILLIVGMPLLMPQKLDVFKHYWYTPIAAPPVSVWKPQPPVKLNKPVPVKETVVAKKEPEPEVVEPPKPKMISPVFSSPITKPATARRRTPAPDLPDVAAAFPSPKPMSLGSSATPTIRKPRAEVQTGGFGDPNGLPATGNPNKAANISKLGSYDLPTGPGYGNGTGGANGVRGVVPSTGFGNGVATGSGGSGGHGTVKQGVFADQRPSGDAPKVRNAAAAVSRDEPIEILFKPKPVYTEAARQKRIEGDVLLQVVFSATGQVEVLRVVQGLGYGLEDAAQAAARQIRFHPAKRNGQPVDFAATVHITFQLAY
jgi:TonB family protein